MIVLILVLLMLLGLGGGIALILILSAVKREKKTACFLLGQENPDPRAVQRTIKNLSALSMGRDIEGMELVKKLMSRGGT